MRVKSEAQCGEAMGQGSQVDMAAELQRREDQGPQVRLAGEEGQARDAGPAQQARDKVFWTEVVPLRLISTCNAGYTNCNMKLQENHQQGSGETVRPALNTMPAERQGVVLTAC